MVTKLSKDKLIGKTIRFKKRIGDFEKGDKAKIIAVKSNLAYIIQDEFDIQYSILKTTLKNNI